MIKVIKRNGGEIAFEKLRISNAIEKTMRASYIVDEFLSKNIANEVEEYLLNNNIFFISVYDIENIVVKKLKEKNLSLGQNYENYMLTKRKQRQENEMTKKVMDFIEGLDKETSSENSNKKSYLNSTQRDLIAGIISKEISMSKLLPPVIVEAIKSGAIHMHDLDYFVQPETNCFHSKTEFITNKGIRKFSQCYDGEIVKVLNKNGLWKTAIVKKYGKQEMQDIIFTSGRTERIITATHNHRWLLKDGTVTTNLKKGDRLELLPEINHDFKLNKELFCLGFVLGDGSDYYFENSREAVKVRLCGEKIKYLEYFLESGYRIVNEKTNNNDIIVVKHGIAFKNKFLNSKFWKIFKDDDLRSIFEGYYCADGSKDRNEITTSNELLAEMIREISCVAGYHITSEHFITHDTPFKKNAELFVFKFMKKQIVNKNWIVKDIIKRYRKYDAWCVEEKETNSFTLNGGMITGNCCLINLGDMLQNGTVINGKMIKKPRSFQVACTVTTQIMAQIASNQYGGQSIDLKHLAPFVNISRQKYLKKMENIIKDEKTLEEVVETLVFEEVKSGIQTINYQINTLNTSNGQAPFVTIFINLEKGMEYEEDFALIIRELLKQRIEGIENEVGIKITPTFPKLVFVTNEDNIHKESKYYDILELSAKCTAHRMYPDYVSSKVMKRLYEGNVFSPMGCVEGQEVITYKINNNLYVESFERAWNRLSKITKPKGQNFEKDLNLIIDCKDENITIYDNKKQDFVKVFNMIRNIEEDWRLIKLEKGYPIQVTHNHLFTTENKGDLFASNLQIDDELFVSNIQYFEENYNQSNNLSWLQGFFIADGCYQNSHVFASIAEKSEDDIENFFIKTVKEELDYEVKVKIQNRGKKGNYKDLRLVGNENKKLKDIETYFENLYGGKLKINRSIPNFIFSSSRENRLAFLAGMIDADGYINNNGSRTVIQVGSTNKELAIQQALLAKTLNMKSSIYLNKYKKENDNIRYRVEFVPSKELLDFIVSEKKKNNYKEHKNRKIEDYSVNKITEIKTIKKSQYSYDLQTESEHFEVSSIYSHNCRSFLNPWKNEKGEYQFEGRFNFGVCTINLPQIAILAQKNKELFFNILYERLQLVKQVGLIRYNRLKNVKASISPIHWQHGGIARLEPDEKIGKLFLDGRSTVSVGYIGLHETIFALINESITTDEGHELAKEIMIFINKEIEKWRKQTRLYFSLYGTPGEATAGKLCEIDRKRFGKIDGVTDKGYYTNSYHVTPSEEIDAFSKLQKESELQSLSLGGSISYIEIPNMTKNIEAIISVIKFMYDNMLYAEFNTKLDNCHVCGFEGEMLINQNLEWECPQCGNRDLNRMNIIRRTCGYLGECSGPT